MARLSILSQAEVAFCVREERGLWGTLSPEQETIVAMQAQFENLKDPQLKLDTSKKSDKKKKSKSKEKKVEKSNKRDEHGTRWQDKNPEGKSTMKKNDNDGAGMWVTHSLDECRFSWIFCIPQYS